MEMFNVDRLRHQPTKQEQMERAIKERRELRRKAAKKLAKQRENERKQRKADRLKPAQFKETPQSRLSYDRLCQLFCVVPR